TRFPGIELYDADESHPSQAGSYAAACCFYTALFRKNPIAISYNYTLSTADAADIRTAVKAVAYDSMRYWHLGQYRTEARFSYTLSAGTVAFTSTADNAAAQTWYFGDGATTTIPNPIHMYAGPGTYLVMQVVQDASGSCTDTAYALLYTGTSSVPDAAELAFGLSPNPVTNCLYIDAAVFLSGTYSILVCNELGQTILEQTSLRALRQSINLSACPNGLYLLSVSKDGQVFYRGKVLKK
ncbi:MAG TPA: PKD domain-containing protein, partial [Chitinophagaceae bacterium]|nr:PKD domain-containing protein [Chitinophagaceae bacterium]